MDKDTRLPRTVRGKRPPLLDGRSVDEVHSMVLVLAQELVALRERFDAAEMVAANHGIDLPGEIERLQLDEASLQRRETWRQAFFQRLFYLTAQRRAELEKKHGDETYLDVLDEIANT